MAYNNLPILCFSLCTVQLHCSEVADTKKLMLQEHEGLAFMFYLSNQTTNNAPEIFQQLKILVQDAALSIKTIQYLECKTNLNGQVLKEEQLYTSSLLNYYIRYQHYLLRPLHHPFNPFYTFDAWFNLKKAEQNLSQSFELFCNTNNITLQDELTTTKFFIERMVKEFINSENHS